MKLLNYSYTIPGGECPVLPHYARLVDKAEAMRFWFIGTIENIRNDIDK